MFKQWAVAVLAFLGLVGCSSFPQDFKQAAAQPAPTRVIAGAWQGRWASDGGHHGELRCLLTESVFVPMKPGAPVIYEARFEATFWKIFTAHYAVELSGSTRNGATTLSGDHDLGWLAGGKYHYEAKVTPEKFDARYQSKADKGTFEMGRPGQ